MLAGIRSRLSYANVMATIAVFIALGAGAYAAGLAPNSVKSKHIVNDQVKARDVAANAIGTDEIANLNVTGVDVGLDAITSAKVSNGSLTGDDIDESSLGPVTSLADDAITASNLGTITRRSNSISVPGGTGENGSYFTEKQTVNCQAGEVALNGDAFWSGAQDDEELFISEMVYSYTPSGGPIGLNVTVGNDSGVDRQLNIAVYCLAP